MIYLYDRTGAPTAYFNDDIIYALNGYPLGFLSNEYVYAFSGKQLGIFELGWVRDLWGFCVLFTENATGIGPLKPLRQLPASFRQSVSLHIQGLPKNHSQRKALPLLLHRLPRG